MTLPTPRFKGGGRRPEVRRERGVKRGRGRKGWGKKKRGRRMGIAHPLFTTIYHDIYATMTLVVNKSLAI